MSCRRSAVAESALRHAANDVQPAAVAVVDEAVVLSEHVVAGLQPSADLAPIVGSNPIPRSEVTKRVWDYIKANGLQDQQNKRMINADDKLRKIFGGKNQVSMFEMTALVNKHLKA